MKEVLSDTAFTQQLILLIVDKLGLALLILIIGYFINKAIERYKSNQAIREEITKKRIEIIAPLWQQINDLHLAVQDYDLPGLVTGYEYLDKVRQDLKNSEEKALENIRKQKFWLGEILENKLLYYLNKVRHLIETIENFHRYYRSIQIEGEDTVEFDEKEGSMQNTLAIEEVKQAFLDVDKVIHLLIKK